MVYRITFFLCKLSAGVKYDFFSDERCSPGGFVGFVGTGDYLAT